MTSRQLKARLDRLAAQLPTTRPAAAVCRWHGTTCDMGRRPPVPYPRDPNDNVEWITDRIREAKIAKGEDVGPHPRELWARDWHEQIPQDELDRDAAEVQALIAEAKAVNEETLRRLREREPGASVYAVRDEMRDREVFAQITRQITNTPEEQQ